MFTEVRAAIRSQPLAKSRPNPSARRTPSNLTTTTSESAPSHYTNILYQLGIIFYSKSKIYTMIPRLTKISRSGITFVSRNLMLSGVSLLAVSNVNNPVGLVGLPYVMWSAYFFVTHIQTEKISSWNGPTVHVCCFMLARASTKTFVSRIHIR